MSEDPGFMKELNPGEYGHQTEAKLSHRTATWGTTKDYKNTPAAQFVPIT